MRVVIQKHTLQQSVGLYCNFLTCQDEEENTWFKSFWHSEQVRCCSMTLYTITLDGTISPQNDWEMLMRPDMVVNDSRTKIKIETADLKLDEDEAALYVEDHEGTLWMMEFDGDYAPQRAETLLEIMRIIKSIDTRAGWEKL